MPSTAPRAALLAALAGGFLLAADQPTREQQALARDLDGRTAGKTETCVATNTGTALQIIDSQTLSYRDGRTLWVNKLRAPCPGLRPLDTLVVETQGSSYCRGDRFRTIAQGSSIPTAFCFLGDFTPWRKPN